MTMNYRRGIIFCSCRILINQKKRDIFDEYDLIWGHDCAYQIRKKKNYAYDTHLHVHFVSQSFLVMHNNPSRNKQIFKID
jgi:hypothetical protein